MKTLIFLGFAAVAVVATAITRNKRQATYELPAGAELIFPGTIKSTFQCGQQAYGYYADVDNGCYLFHICHPVTHPDGSSQVLQYSFICGNQTIFDQASLTCNDPGSALPCGSAPQFFQLNNRIGNEKEPFLTEQDVAQADQLRTGGGAPAPGRG